MPEDSCPWSGLRSAPLSFCEEPLCGWLKQPGNTWSNIGFLLVAFLIWKRALRKRKSNVTWFAIVSASVGLGSAFYHASGAYLAGIADYGGMFLITGAMTAMNSKRWLGLSHTDTRWIFVGTAAVLLGLMIFFPAASRLLYVLAAPCCLIELRLYFRDGDRTRFKFYLLSWLAVVVGAVAWWLDQTKLVCDPANHILPLHAVWHLLMALALYFLYRFYEQFPELNA